MSVCLVCMKASFDKTYVTPVLNAGDQRFSFRDFRKLGSPHGDHQNAKAKDIHLR